MADDIPASQTARSDAGRPGCGGDDAGGRSRRAPGRSRAGVLFGVDDEGDAVVNALVPAVLRHFQEREGLTCYQALIEGLTGIWNAAVRAAVVARLRATAPPDDLLIRLQKLSPTLGFAKEKADWVREWLADPSPRTECSCSSV